MTKPSPNFHLQRARESRNWSQKDVASKIGSTVGNVSRWERRVTSPSPYYRRKLCDLFDEEAEALGLLEEKEEAQPRLQQDDSLGPLQRNRIDDPMIPFPSTDAIGLIGRDALFAQLKRRLCTGSSLALHGLPGVGKTALVLALLRDPQVQAHFREGILWASPGPRPALPEMLSRWCTLLGIADEALSPSAASDETQAMRLRAKIGMQRLLIVIDDVWDLEEAMALKVGSLHCAYLLTTRVPSVAAAFTPQGAVRVPELSESDGVEVLARLAPEVVQADQATAHALVRSVGALPLALTLMGNYLHVQTYCGNHTRRMQVAIERLQHAEERLRLSTPVAFAERHPGLPSDRSLSLMSMIAVSDQQLNDEARATLSALSIFPAKPQSFSEHAALAVSKRPVEALDTLIDAGLLEGVAPDRYTMHQTIADYARTHLKEESVWQRFIAYWVNYATTHAHETRILIQESKTIQAALEAAAQRGFLAELVQGACSFAPFLLRRGLYSQADALLAPAHEAAQSTKNILAVVQLLSLLGIIAEKRGKHTQAVASVEEAATYAHRFGFRERECALRLSLGVIQARQGQRELAAQSYQAALSMAYEHGDEVQISAASLNLGWLAQDQGVYAQAEHHYQEGLRATRTLGQSGRQCVLLLHLGEIALLRGKLVQAEAAYQEGLALTRQLGEREAEKSLLFKLKEQVATLEDNVASEVSSQGEARLKSADHAKAELFFRDGLTLARQIGYLELMCRLLTGLAIVAANQGDDAKADACYWEALPLARQLGDRERTCLVLLNLGEIASRQDQHKRACHNYREGLRLARQMGHPERITLFLLKWGEISLSQGDYAQATASLQEGLDVARQSGHHRQVGLALALWGELHLQQHQKQHAAAAFHDLLTDLPAGNQDLLARAQYGLARVFAAQGDESKAYDYAKASLALYEAISHPDAMKVKGFLEVLMRTRMG